MAELIHIAFNKLDFVVLPVALALPPLYIYLGKPWYITNMLSFCFAYSAIKAMKLDGFLTGAALLAGLFLYDIFWVFGTPVVSFQGFKRMDSKVADWMVCTDGECGQESRCAYQGE